MAPLQYFTGEGRFATPVVHLGWGLIVISLAVLVIVSALLVIAIVRHQRRRMSDPLPPPTRDLAGVRAIYFGVAVTVVLLIISATWTMETLAALAPPRHPGMTIEVHGHQFWWEFRYLGTTPDQTFTTANEIHLPVGVPVRFLVTGDDVIHSFWVPQLAGKTDAIPGRINHAWLEADQAGVYYGQCTEYCGLQHAHMGLRVVAESPERFAAWRQHQLAPATNSPSGASGATDANPPGPDRSSPTANDSNAANPAQAAEPAQGSPAGPPAGQTAGQASGQAAGQDGAQAAAQPEQNLTARGEAVFVTHCGACHTVRGTPAGGVLGPDLTHVASRAMIAAETLPFKPEALKRWIADAPAVKPGVLMPRTNLSPAELDAVTSYVSSLN